MADKRRIEIYSAGCLLCEEAAELVSRIACPSCDVQVLDMNDAGVARQAKRLGLRSVPAVVVDGRLADCCAGGGAEEASLKAAGIGTPRP
jgi:hypothetical protein